MSEKFEGFDRPYYTQVPDQLIDELMPTLSGAELKVLLYVVRRTFGFKKDSDRISKSQMENGITTRDGRRLDGGTGLSRRAIRLAVDNLVERNILIKENGTRPDGGNETTLYRLHIKGDGVESTPGVETTPSSGYSEPPQETEQQETEIKTAFERLITDFSREFNDEHPRSSLTRVARLYADATLDPDEFVRLMYEARSRTQRFTGNIRAGEPGRRNKMPYWFSTLEDLIRQREAGDG